jgi:hypothetical protein
VLQITVTFATLLYLRMKISHSHNKADYIGILGSLLCIVHCLAMPVLALGSAFGHDHHMHIGFLSLDYLFILINAAAVYFATREHRSAFVRILLWSALLLFAVSLIFEERNVAWLSWLCVVNHRTSDQPLHLPDCSSNEIQSFLITYHTGLRNG